MKKVYAIMDRKEDGSGLYLRSDDPTCKLADQYVRQLFWAGDSATVVLTSELNALELELNELREDQDQRTQEALGRDL